MTLYQKNVTVGSNTSKSAPETAEMTVREPVIYEVQIFFPPPSGHLVHASVWYGEHQFLPHPEYDWASANGETIKSQPLFESGEDETTVRLEAYNEDDTYSHTLMWRVKARESWRVYWKRSIHELVSKLTSFMRWMGG